MTASEVTADAQAVSGLRNVADTAIATLAEIERCYDEAIAQVAFLAASRAPAQGAWTVAPAGVQPEADVQPEAGVAAEPEPRVSPLVEALLALQDAGQEQPGQEPATGPQPVRGAGLTAVPVVFPVAPVGPVTEVVPLPRSVDEEWIAGRHAEAATEEIPVQAA